MTSGLPPSGPHQPLETRGPRPDLRVGFWLIRLASWLTPGSRRGEIRAQWEADLIHLGRRAKGALLLFWCLGAFKHSWLMFRTEYSMDSILQDLKFGLRSLNRSRAIIAIATLSLAIGIGANAAIFSVVDVFMIRPLPYPDSERLHLIWIRNSERGIGRASFTVPDFQDLQSESRTMALAATRHGVFNLSGDFEAERLRGVYVSPDFFGVIGVHPALGRGFTREEGVPGNDQVAVISNELWARRFGADPEIVGTSIVLDGTSFTVVGVTPPHFWYRTPDQDVWVPLAFTGEESRGRHYVGVLARIRDGFTVEQAREEANQVMGRISEAYPETSAGHEAIFQTLHENVFNEGFRSGSLISTVAVAFLLLIACANVANLLLTHAAGREREVALRGALGAARGRIVRQFLTEAILVAAAGGILGIGFAVLGIRGLIGIMPQEFPRVHEIGLNGRVLLFTGGVTILTGIVFGLAPALQFSKSNLTDPLKDGGRGGTGSRGGRLRKLLVVTEVAMALVLLVSSALLVQGFRKVRLGDPGFDSRDVLAMRTLLPEAQYPDTSAVNDYYLLLSSRLKAIPGVRSVGGTTVLPAQGNSNTWYVVDEEDYGDQHARKVINFRFLLPGYFEAMDIPILQGRGILDTDRPGSVPVAVISQSAAQKNWPGENPIGHRITTGNISRQVVGVVANTREATADESDTDMAYFSAFQARTEFMEWAIESDVPLETLREPVRAEVRRMDPTIPAYDLMTLDALIDEGMGGNLIMAKIMSIVAIVALVLALGGVYGVMGYSVAQRTQEMGIRMSLGAASGTLMKMVVYQGVVLASTGILIGVGLAMAVTRGLAFFLFGVNPFDPLTFTVVSVLLFMAGVGATILPARRATRVDPVRALRTE